MRNGVVYVVVVIEKSWRKDIARRTMPVRPTNTASPRNPTDGDGAESENSRVARRNKTTIAAPNVDARRTVSDELVDS
jgi:hypothetical protein